MKAATLLTLFCCALICAAQPKPKRSTLAGIAPDDCNQQFAGSARKAVKLRKASDGSTYAKVNGGNAISVSDWFAMTCALDPKVPGTVPASKPMKDIETQAVTLQGFLMAAKLDPDHDLHAEIAGSNKWNTPHLIVEVPPGQEYCSARKALWDLVAQELPPNSTSKTHIMQHPPQVQLTGYVFLDTAHGSTNFCHTSGGRGVKKQGVQKVQGLWEIHPVLDLAGQ
jgi:hypothetical protein